VPAPALRSADFWIARLTFVLLVPATADVTFALSADDSARMAIDNEVLLLAGGGSRSIVAALAQGFHIVELHCLEGTGDASPRLLWDAGVPGAVSAGS
jgi:hypothetical protein